MSASFWVCRNLTPQILKPLIRRSCQARTERSHLQVIVQVITLAFLVVGGSVGFMIPVMLYILDLKRSGWNWQYVSLFISMLASTDAVAIISTMKTSKLYSYLRCKLPRPQQLLAMLRA